MKTSKDHPDKRYEVGPFGILRLKIRGAVVTHKIIQDLANEADDIEYKKVGRHCQGRRSK
jgi:hypothetical protein